MLVKFKNNHIIIIYMLVIMFGFIGRVNLRNKHVRFDKFVLFKE